jgi:hypothetical protein
MILEVQEWVKRNRLGARQARMLLEAYRRFYMFEKPRKTPLSDAWLGLGGSEYRDSKYFQGISSSISLPIKNYPLLGVNWYKLSDKGKSVMSDLIAHLPWKSSLNQVIFDNELI